MKTKAVNKKLFITLFAMIFCIALPFVSACDQSVDDELTDGEFYTMRQAYDEGFLSFEELLSIAYYNNGGTTGNGDIMGEGYVPIAKSPETLSDYTENSIRQSMANDLNEVYETEEYKSQNIGVSLYCGTYGNGVAVIMLYGEAEGGDVTLNCVYGEYTIEGVTFCYTAETTFFNTGDFTFDNHVMLWMPKTGKNGLTEAQSAEVEQAWNEQNECALVWYDEETNTKGLICLGVYNGYIVLYDDYGWQGYDVACVVTEKDIGGYVFEHNYPFSLYAYSDGVFNELEDVYRAGNITADNIAKIFSAYSSYNL